jgi:hypothetical protein
MRNAAPVVAMKHFEPDRDDRASLLALIAALDASPRALQRDLVRGEGRTGDWAICGTLGHIYPDGTGFLMYVASDESARRWTNVKARLSFATLTQDGDDEGCFRLDRLPSPHEAAAIREAIGIRKRRHLSDDAKAKARSAAECARLSINRPLPLQD